MSEEEIMEEVQWAIDVNHITRSINGDNTSINVNAIQGLLDLYNKEKFKNLDYAYPEAVINHFNKINNILKGE